MDRHINKSALILGVGNDILCDDGVGIHAARRASVLLSEGPDSEPAIQVLETSVAGMALLDLLGGYFRAVIIDAVLDPSSEPGDVAVSTIEKFNGSAHLVTAHQIDLPTVVVLGETLGEALPKEIFVVAVVAQDVSSFAEKCTPMVAGAIEPAARLAIEIARTGQADLSHLPER